MYYEKNDTIGHVFRANSFVDMLERRSYLDTPRRYLFFHEETISTKLKRFIRGDYQHSPTFKRRQQIASRASQPGQAATATEG